MELYQMVLLTEAGHLQLTSFSRHVLYHTITVLLPSESMQTVLPKSGSAKIESFCIELMQTITSKRSRKKFSAALSSGSGLIPSLEMHKFLEHVTTVVDFTLLLEKHLLEMSGGEIDVDKLLEICWTVYELAKGKEVSIPRRFSPTCTCRLWLIFCFVQEQTLGDMLPTVTANEVIKRLVELCGYTWNQTYSYTETEEVTFPQYLRAIGNCFTRLKLEMSLTSEVIVDLVDEIIHGVLKKGFLIKKGHKRKNWKKRWFVLQKTVMRYFESRESKNIKGQLVLNTKTTINGLADRGKRKYIFEVTCGLSGIPFEICADDQRSKQEWMLSIGKAIALAEVFEGSSKQEEFTECLGGFYLLKYGTRQPSLERQDSSLSKMKYQATLKDQRRRLGGLSNAEGSVDSPLSESGGKSDDDSAYHLQDDSAYPLQDDSAYPLQDDSSDGDTSDVDSYTSMSCLKEAIEEALDSRQGMSKSVECLNTNTSGLGWNQDGITSSAHSQSRICDFSKSVEPSDILRCGDSTEDVYMDAKVRPRYHLEEDNQVGGYIDTVYAEESFTKKKPDSYKNLTMPCQMMKLDDDDEVSKLTARCKTLESVSENRSPANYLTIIRSDEIDEPRRRGSEEIHDAGNSPPPPIPDRRSSLPLASEPVQRPRAPPPLLPRPKLKKILSPGLTTGRSLASQPHHPSQDLNHHNTDPLTRIGHRNVSSDTIPPVPPKVLSPGREARDLASQPHRPSLGLIHHSTDPHSNWQ